jgi:hypothetical protein
MSWFLIFISSFVPILLLAAIVVAESLKDAGTKLHMVRVPLRGTNRTLITKR